MRGVAPYLKGDFSNGKLITTGIYANKLPNKIKELVFFKIWNIKSK